MGAKGRDGEGSKGIEEQAEAALPSKFESLPTKRRIRGFVNLQTFSCRSYLGGLFTIGASQKTAHAPGWTTGNQLIRKRVPTEAGLPVPLPETLGDLTNVSGSPYSSASCGLI